MKIGVVTRNDTDRITGGDAVMLHNICKRIAALGVDMRSVSVAELERFTGDALHLTQLYQPDVAEAALGYATSRRVPLFASPLVEEHLALWWRQAVTQPTKWRRIASVGGQRLTGLVYRQWQTIRRFGSQEWQRQRRILAKTYLAPNSQYELRHLSRWFALPDLAGAIVPLGVDPELYGEAAHAAEALPADVQALAGRYVLHVGVISRRKNQDGLLRALADTEVPIVFLGLPSPYEPDYYREVVALAAQRKDVVFLARLPEQALPALYRGAALQILPSWSERPGLVTLEAAACGCKVVASNRSPIYEYLGARAWYCDPDSTDSIRQAVQEALAKPAPADLSSYVLSQFTWQRTAERLRDVYERVLST